MSNILLSYEYVYIYIVCVYLYISAVQQRSIFCVSRNRATAAVMVTFFARVGHAWRDDTLRRDIIN